MIRLKKIMEAYDYKMGGKINFINQFEEILKKNNGEFKIKKEMPKVGKTERQGSFFTGHQMKNLFTYKLQKPFLSEIESVEKDRLMKYPINDLYKMSVIKVLDETSGMQKRTLNVAYVYNSDMILGKYETIGKGENNKLDLPYHTVWKYGDPYESHSPYEGVPAWVGDHPDYNYLAFNNPSRGGR